MLYLLFVFYMMWVVYSHPVVYPENCTKITITQSKVCEPPTLSCYSTIEFILQATLGEQLAFHPDVAVTGLPATVEGLIQLCLHINQRMSSCLRPAPCTLPLNSYQDQDDVDSYSTTC